MSSNKSKLAKKKNGKSGTRKKSPTINGNYQVGYNENQEFKPSGLRQPAGKSPKTKKGNGKKKASPPKKSSPPKKKDNKVEKPVTKV